MENEIKNYELIKLDLILSTIRINETSCINAEGIIKKLQTNFNRPGYTQDKLFADVDLYLQILIEDKFVDEDKCAKPLGVKINLRGIIHLKHGGYTGKQQAFEESQKEKERIKTFETRLKTRQTIQNWWLVGLGSIAALYYLIEIMKFLYHLTQFLLF